MSDKENQTKNQTALAEYKQSLTPVPKGFRDISRTLSSEKVQEQIAKALPTHMNVQKFTRIALTCLQRNPKLQECDPMSFCMAIVEAAEMGLEPSSVLGAAYLLPIKNNKQGIVECQLLIGYRGFIDLAVRSGKVQHISAHIVYEDEVFDHQEGTAPHIVHKPNNDRSGDVPARCAYAVAHLTSGATAQAVLSLADIDKRREKSANRRDSPWDTHWPEMAKKSAIRALAKTLPMSSELVVAAINDEIKEDK